MKKLANIIEVEGEGLVSLMGEKVILMCMNYNYGGTLIGVNDHDVLLSADDACVIYETGSWSDKVWKDAQKVNKPLYVRISSIESYFAAGK